MRLPARVPFALGCLVAAGCLFTAGCGGDRPLSLHEQATVMRHGPKPTAEGHPAPPLSCTTRPARDVSLSKDVVPILVSGCSGEFCHGLAMTSASRAHEFLVNQPSLECDDLRPLVTPGDPDRSYMVDKILGRNLCAGHPMPRGLSNALSAEEIRTVTDWICEGAPSG